MSELVPLIFSNKVPSPGYNGGSYETYWTGLVPPGSPLYVSLSYSNNGSWGIANNGNLFNGGSPMSGTWTTSPATSYEFYMTGVIGGSMPITGSTYQGIPVATWTAIGANTLVAKVEQPNPSQQGYYSVQFTLLVRKVGTTTPEVSTTIQMAYEYAA